MPLLGANGRPGPAHTYAAHKHLWAQSTMYRKSSARTGALGKAVGEKFISNTRPVHTSRDSFRQHIIADYSIVQVPTVVKNQRGTPTPPEPPLAPQIVYCDPSPGPPPLCPGEPPPRRS